MKLINTRKPSKRRHPSAFPIRAKTYITDTNSMEELGLLPENVKYFSDEEEDMMRIKEKYLGINMSEKIVTMAHLWSGLEIALSTSMDYLYKAVLPNDRWDILPWRRVENPVQSDNTRLDPEVDRRLELFLKD